MNAGIKTIVGVGAISFLYVSVRQIVLTLISCSYIAGKI